MNNLQSVLAMNNTLHEAWGFVTKTFFPKWDKQKYWKIEVNDNLIPIGLCICDEKRIVLQYLRENIDDLYLIIIHEICHAYSPNHENKWQKRVLKAAKKAKSIGYNNLADLLLKEVESYRKLPKITARIIYQGIFDAVIDCDGNSPYESIVDWIAREYGSCPVLFELTHKKCRKAYESGMKFINDDKKLREKFKTMGV